MTGINLGVTGKYKKLLLYGFDELSGIAGGKVASADTARKKRISRDKKACVLYIKQPLPAV